MKKFLWMWLGLALIFSESARGQATVSPELDIFMSKATLAIKSALNVPDSISIRENFKNSAFCVGSIPDYEEVNLFAGYGGGSGVITCRIEEGGKSKGWSQPLFIYLQNYSLGLALGYKHTPLVLVFMCRKAPTNLGKEKSLYSASAGASLAQFGRQIAFATASNKCGVYTYGESSGANLTLMQLSVTDFSIDEEKNRSVYGNSFLEPKDILASPISNTGWAQSFIDTISLCSDRYDRGNCQYGNSPASVTLPPVIDGQKSAVEVEQIPQSIPRGTITREELPSPIILNKPPVSQANSDQQPKLAEPTPARPAKPQQGMPAPSPSSKAASKRPQFDTSPNRSASSQRNNFALPPTTYGTADDKADAQSYGNPANNPDYEIPAD